MQLQYINNNGTEMKSLKELKRSEVVSKQQKSYVLDPSAAPGGTERFSKKVFDRPCAMKDIINNKNGSVPPSKYSTPVSNKITQSNVDALFRDRSLSRDNSRNQRITFADEVKK